MRGTLLVTLLALPAVIAAQGGEPSRKVLLTYEYVRPHWDMLRPHLPAPLDRTPAAGLDGAWREWVEARDDINRSRVARGDED